MSELEKLKRENLHLKSIIRQYQGIVGDLKADMRETEYQLNVANQKAEAYKEAYLVTRDALHTRDILIGALMQEATNEK